MEPGDHNDDSTVVPFRTTTFGTPSQTASAGEERVRNELAAHGEAPDELSDVDQRAADDEVIFRQRFGFDWPRLHRRRLLWLKRDLDLTDVEIRLLQRTGNFVLDPGAVRVRARRWHWLWGWFQIWCLGLFVGVPFAVVLSSKTLLLLPWQWAMLILWALGTWWVGRGIHWYWVRPFQIVRRTEANAPVTG
jgi:hypothetical protein